MSAGTGPRTLSATSDPAQLHPAHDPSGERAQGGTARGGRTRGAKTGTPGQDTTSADSALQIPASPHVSPRMPTLLHKHYRGLSLLSPLAEQGPCLPSPLPRSHPSPPVDPLGLLSLPRSHSSPPWYLPPLPSLPSSHSTPRREPIPLGRHHPSGDGVEGGLWMGGVWDLGSLGPLERAHFLGTRSWLGWLGKGWQKTQWFQHVGVLFSRPCKSSPAEVS